MTILVVDDRAEIESGSQSPAFAKVIKILDKVGKLLGSRITCNADEKP